MKDHITTAGHDGAFAAYINRTEKPVHRLPQSLFCRSCSG